MKIRLSIFDYTSKKGKGREPQKYEYNGIWALEEMIKRLLTEYYSEIIAVKVIDLLKDRKERG
jgi:hypothetical protein